MFQMVVERLFVPELWKIDDTDKRLSAIAVTHLLCDPPAMINGIYFNQLWICLFHALLKLFQSSSELQIQSIKERKQQEQEQAEEDLIVGLDDTPGLFLFYSQNKRKKMFFVLNFEDYTPAFSRLAFAKKAPVDLFGSSIPDARCHLAKCLQTLTSTHPNQVRLIFSVN